MSCGAHRHHVPDPAARYLAQASARARIGGAAAGRPAGRAALVAEPADGCRSCRGPGRRRCRCRRRDRRRVVEQRRAAGPRAAPPRRQPEPMGTAARAQRQAPPSATPATRSGPARPPRGSSTPPERATSSRPSSSRTRSRSHEPESLLAQGHVCGGCFASRRGGRADSELVAQRERLTERFALMQSELGGLFYEMAIRDHVQMDVLVAKAAELQQLDVELGQIEHLLVTGGGQPQGIASVAVPRTPAAPLSARSAARRCRRPDPADTRCVRRAMSGRAMLINLVKQVNSIKLTLFTTRVLPPGLARREGSDVRDIARAGLARIAGATKLTALAALAAAGALALPATAAAATVPAPTIATSFTPNQIDVTGSSSVQYSINVSERDGQQRHVHRHAAGRRGARQPGHRDRRGLHVEHRLGADRDLHGHPRCARRSRSRSPRSRPGLRARSSSRWSATRSATGPTASPAPSRSDQRHRWRDRRAHNGRPPPRSR